MSLDVLCVNVGESFGDIYVERLFNMLGRNVSRPFKLTCYTDRVRKLDSQIEQVDISGWGLQGTLPKLRLFDRESNPRERFLYLDVTLVIKRPLDPIIERCESAGKPMLLLQDWFYDCVNSCVMWIEPCDATQTVWDTYASGVKYEYKRRIKRPMTGDQDFLDAVIADKGLQEHVGWLPNDEISSYRFLRNTFREDPVKAAKLVETARIIKYHGQPKPHELLDVWQTLKKVGLKYPLRPHTWGYLRRETREWWR